MRPVTLSVLGLLLLACGAGDTAEPGTVSSSGETADPHGQPSGGGASDDPAGPTDRSPAVEAIGGVDPFGNSVADDDVDPQACAGSGERPDGACRVNSDCGICHDGSDCGRPANREEIDRLGAACRREDAAECEYSVVRCCSGHCQVTGS